MIMICIKVIRWNYLPKQSHLNPLHKMFPNHMENQLTPEIKLALFDLKKSKALLTFGVFINPV